MLSSITDGLQHKQKYLQFVKKAITAKQKDKVKLTERSFHAMGRTRLGIPDQLNFRNSSIKKKKYFMITKNKMIINIDRYIQITKKLFTLIMSSYEVQ